MQCMHGTWNHKLLVDVSHDFPSAYNHACGGIAHHVDKTDDIELYSVQNRRVAAVTSLFQYTRAEMCVCHRQCVW